MDISALLGTIMSSDSIKNMSQLTNVSSEGVQGVLGSALPSLLNGALAQSEGSDTAEGFAGALTQHAAVDTSDINAFLGNVDMEDGAKIVGHLLGSDSSAVFSEAAKKAGVSEKDSSNILSAAAPLLMSLLGKETGAQSQSGASGGIAGIMGALLKNADMGSLLSGLLGGGMTASDAKEEKDEKKEKKGLLGSLLDLIK
ncbi:MAG: DUF937 domain-containing protein [Clostridia bacterium]|nr:DUF937 domain-containing protein [Clostridia bacterium]